MTTLENLSYLEGRLDAIASRWNGDESGLLEDKAHAANEGIKKISELKQILNELNIL